MPKVNDAKTADTEMLDDDATEPRIYEFCMLYPSNLTQKDESNLLKEIEKTIEETGAKQVAKDMWGKRGLAYKIKGHTEGCYVVYHYEMDPDALKEVDVSLRIIPNLLRHIIVKPPRDYEVEKFSEKFELWLQNREQEVDRKQREKEERLAKRVADKAKRQVKRAADAKKEEAETPKETDTKKISEELDKLISDDDLDI